MSTDVIYDLLLKDGHVIDPANNIDERWTSDQGSQDQEGCSGYSSKRSHKSSDVSDHYVTPGIIDIHTHVYTGCYLA